MLRLWLLLLHSHLLHANSTKIGLLPLLLLLLLLLSLLLLLLLLSLLTHWIRRSGMRGNFI